MKMKTTNSISNTDINHKQETKSKLYAIFNDSCVKHGVVESEKNNLIINGVGLFEINTSGDVFPLGSYQTIAEYVIAHRIDIIHDDNSNNLTKEQLYNRLSKSAKAGNMVEYRRLRKQYSALA